MNFDGVKVAETLQKILLPALAGAAGTGALAGYMSSRSNPRNELPSDRRKRILRNALIGSALGGTAVAAVPAGLSMLGSELGGGGHPVSMLAEKVRDYAIPGGVGALGVGMMSKARGGQQERALRHILSQVRGKNVGGIKGGIKGTPDIMQLMETKPQASELIKALVTKGKSVPGMPGAKANFQIKSMLNRLQLLQEAGLQDYGFKDLPNRISQSARFEPALKEYLQQQSGLGKYGPLSWLPKAVGSAEGIGGPSETAVAEKLLKWIRPSVARMPGIRNFPVSNLTRAGLIGGGVLGANWLQNKFLSK